MNRYIKNIILSLLTLSLIFPQTPHNQNNDDAINLEEFKLVDRNGQIIMTLTDLNAEEFRALLNLIDSHKVDMDKTLVVNNFVTIEMIESIKNDISAIPDLQKSIGRLESKIDALDKKIASISKPPAPNANNKKNDKPKSDPNKIYDIAEAGSTVFGNPNASVTIIKWTDFQ